VFGGAFDPPHVAHVALARAALEQLRLDELRIFPTGDAWHKERTLTAPAHRLAMARIAFSELPRTVIDDRELRRVGPTYTVDTLRELQAEHPRAELFLVMGEDQASSFERWREWQAILGMAVLCVASRPHAMRTQGPSPSWPERVMPISLPAMPESATEVRARLIQERDVTGLVPSGVASYIESQHLYRTHR
jgi:nicotinate-nucleotide adenylyltransferase